jgi:hypothetical protein
MFLCIKRLIDIKQRKNDKNIFIIFIETFGGFVMYFCGGLKLWNKIKICRIMGKDYTRMNKPAENITPIVIYMADGKITRGGLGDRLRGILSLYAFCQTNNIGFKVYFLHPFHLCDYLEPNHFNWYIDARQISYNSIDAKPLLIYCTYVKYNISAESEIKYQYKLLQQEIKNSNYKQYHVYTNANFVRGSDYSRYFYQLFKPAIKLQQSIDMNLANIGNDFVAMAFRFQQLLRDFKDATYHTLTKEEGDKLIKKNIEKVKEIYCKYHKTTPLLVTSDSKRFLDEINKLDFVYVIPGRIVHVEYAFDNDYKLHLKTFLDLMVLSKAKKIYLLCTEGMYCGGFAKSAALINNTNYEEIIF